MTSRRAEKTKTCLALVCAVIAVSLGVYLFLSAYQLQHWDTDIFWAIKSGEWIVTKLKVPHTDPFSYTFYGRAWVDFTWGFQVLAYLFYSKAGGWTGLFLLQLLLTVPTFAFVYLNLKRLSQGRAWLALIITFLVYISSNSRLFIRPHLFEYFFVSLYLLILTIHERSGRGWVLYLLLPLQVLWINVHSSAILGVFVIGAYALGEIIDEIRHSSSGLKTSFTSKVTRLIAVSVLAPLVSAVNPYGFKLTVFPFIHQGGENAEALRHIGEWSTTPVNELLFYVYPFPMDHFAFEIFLIGALALLAVNARRARSRDFIIIPIVLYMAVSHARWNTLFAYFAAPVVVANLAQYLNGGGAREGAVKWGGAALALLMSGFMAYGYTTPQARSNMGLGLQRGVYPEGTVEFMKKNGVRGNIFNEYVFGGYIIKEYPEQKVFIDGRTPTVYSPYFFWTARLAAEPKSWRRLTREHGINIALVKISDPLCGKLRGNTDWALVSYDDVSALFLKRDTDEFRPVVEKYGFKELNPCVEGKKFVTPKDPAKLRALRAELLRSALDPAAARSARPHRLLALADEEMASLPGADRAKYLLEAIEEFKKSVMLIDDAYANYDLGVALGKLKMYDEAIGAFNHAIHIDGGFKDNYLGMGLLYYDIKDYTKAVKYLKKYVRLSDDEAEPQAYKPLGMSYFNLSRFNDAAVYLRRAAFVSTDGSDADIYYYLGGALFETGDYKEGLASFGRAVEMKPGYLDVIKRLPAELKAKGDKMGAQALTEALESNRLRGKK